MGNKSNKIEKFVRKTVENAMLRGLQKEEFQRTQIKSQFLWTDRTGMGY